MAVSPSVSIEDVAKKLHVSRNYIHKSILPYVRHEKTAQYRVRIDEGELRLWLKENASFSRQTILVPYERHFLICLYYLLFEPFIYWKFLHIFLNFYFLFLAFYALIYSLKGYFSIIIFS